MRSSPFPIYYKARMLSVLTNGDDIEDEQLMAKLNRQYVIMVGETTK